MWVSFSDFLFHIYKIRTWCVSCSTRIRY